MNSSVAITGGLGYLGGRTAVYLKSRGYRVRLLTRRQTQNRPSWSSGMEIYTVNFFDISSLQAAFRNIDAVIHLAAMNAPACAANPAAAWQINVNGTSKVICAAKAEHVQRLIYMSTAHVYCSPLTGRLDETSETTNTHPYAMTHRNAENVVLEAHGLEGIVLRLSNGVGAPLDTNADCWMLVANDLCRQITKKGEMTLRGSGFELRDFIPISEVTRALYYFLTISMEDLQAKLFNLTSGVATSTLELAGHIAERAGIIQDIKTTLDHNSYQDLSPKELVLSTSRLNTCGFHVEASLTSEIDATLNFCRDHLSSA